MGKIFLMILPVVLLGVVVAVVPQTDAATESYQLDDICLSYTDEDGDGVSDEVLVWEYGNEINLDCLRVLTSTGTGAYNRYVYAGGIPWINGGEAVDIKYTGTVSGVAQAGTWTLKVSTGYEAAKTGTVAVTNTYTFVVQVDFFYSIVCQYDVANGSAAISSTMQTVEIPGTYDGVTYGFDVEVTDQEPTRAGYVFMGWTSKDFPGLFLEPGQTSFLWTFNIPIDYTVFTFTAQWAVESEDVPIEEAETHSYELVYLSNNSTPVSDIPPIYRVSNLAASTHTITLSSTAPQSEGWHFKGWCLDPYGEGRIYSPGDGFSMTTLAESISINLYAIWEKGSSSSGGSSGSWGGYDVDEILNNIDFTTILIVAGILVFGWIILRR